jgi:hypothetical protein
MRAARALFVLHQLWILLPEGPSVSVLSGSGVDAAGLFYLLLLL